MLRCFGGLSVDKKAVVVGVLASTLACQWRFAPVGPVRPLGDAPQGAGRARE
jgi:hypothetical protein